MPEVSNILSHCYLCEIISLVTDRRVVELNLVLSLILCCILEMS